MTFTQIQSAIDAAARANDGKAYITGRSCERSLTVRQALERVAYACGMREPRAEGVSNDKLAMLYALARKDMNRAQGMARELNEEQQPRIGGALDELTSPPPVASPAPPVASPEPSPVDLEAILEAARKEASSMADYIAKDRLDKALDGIEASLQTIAERAVANVQPTSLVITLPDEKPKTLGVVHFQTERLIKLLARGSNVYLHGPAGSGKTTAAQKAAEAFKLPFYFTGKVDSEYLLLGFKNAHGETVRTPFREAYENGGLFLFDEMDRSADNAITAMNAALANGVCSFPDGVVKRHDSFKCIAAGNSTMSGADSIYTSAQQQDGAAVDRFKFLDWPYDEKLELAIAPHKQWAEYVQKVRKAVAERGLNHIVSPRASIEGGKDIMDGDTWEEAAYANIWKGLDADTVRQLTDAVEAV